MRDIKELPAGISVKIFPFYQVFFHYLDFKVGHLK
jgi:hypothetical protein